MEKNLVIFAVVLTILWEGFDVPFSVVFLLFIFGTWFIAKDSVNEEKTKIKEANDFLEKTLAASDFTITKRFDTNDTKNKHAFLVDSNSKRLAIFNYDKKSVELITFNSIINVEFIEDNSTVMQGGIGRAIAGGVLAGGVGAIVGAGTRASNDIVRTLQVRIITNNIDDSCKLINIISNPTDEIKRGSDIYNKLFAIGQEVYSIVYSIIEQNKKNEVVNTNNLDSISVSDKIKELVRLKEQQLITENEFESKRTEILARL